MGHDVETLKGRLPLLEYLRQQNWTGRRAGRFEYVGLCPLHKESRPSFYVNTRKDVFYCHGCGQGGDLIRFVQLSRQHLSVRASPIWIHRPIEKLIGPRYSGKQPCSISSSWITVRRRLSICVNADFMILL